MCPYLQFQIKCPENFPEIFVQIALDSKELDTPELCSSEGIHTSLLQHPQFMSICGRMNCLLWYRVWTDRVAAAGLLVELPCLWPERPASWCSLACPSPLQNGLMRARQHPCIYCSFSGPPPPSTWSPIHNPARRAEVGDWGASQNKKTGKIVLDLIVNQCKQAKRAVDKLWQVGK